MARIRRAECRTVRQGQGNARGSRKPNLSGGAGMVHSDVVHLRSEPKSARVTATWGKAADL